MSVTIISFIMFSFSTSALTAYRTHRSSVIRPKRREEIVRKSSREVSVRFSDFNQNGNIMTNHSKSSLIKLYKNPSSGRRTVSCERTKGQSN